MYVLRATEERMPSEFYDGPKAEAEAWETFAEWSDEYLVYLLNDDGTWQDLTTTWIRQYCREYPTFGRADA